MIYIKRIANADITRQIDLNKEAGAFFGFVEGYSGEVRLTFEEKVTKKNIIGFLKKTGHTITITGEIFSEFKQRCQLYDIVVFSSTKKANKFVYQIVNKGSKIYSEFDNSLKLFGSRSEVIGNTTHLVASFDDIEVESQSLNKAFSISLPSLRTKPFLLLAGISGTGKSRVVKQMAFDTCPNKDDLQKDETSPGNYQLIEVKPNWHDSSEVLGYESEIGGAHYVVTPFVKFLVKAMLYEDEAPFFVCMDEMNLAPVEQYFAEFLSVLESRELIGNRITSEALIPAEVFVKHENTGLKAALCGRADERHNNYETATLTEIEAEYGRFNEIYERLKKEGLRIPHNLIVVGTVNMDETTHQFSRKVIDRAMTIEMNIADGTTPFEEFFENTDDLKYRPKGPLDKDLFLPTVVQAKEALDRLDKKNASDVEYLKANVPNLLSSLNAALNGTPFKIAYRVQNELIVYFYELRREDKNNDASAEELLNQAMDAILMQKVLPRVEGDEDLLKEPLKALAEFTSNKFEQAHAKVAEMQSRLDAHFTSFWP